ncbi:MAG: phosphoadenylyl-sulfate reductase [Acidimicrobiales bacterium]
MSSPLTAATRPSPDELSAAAVRLEGAHPKDVLAWVDERFGTDVVATVSFEDAVLAHLVATHAPRADVAFLDTQYHFAETWWLVDNLRNRLGEGFKLQIVRPELSVVPDDRWMTDTEGCCGVRKVEPLQRTITGRAAWITGIRRVDGPTRADAPVLAWDERWGVVKVNPLVAWDDNDMAGYLLAHDLPAHPLADRGYPSVGCWPCTRPVAPGEDKRAGRWAGSDKTECGLHQ